MPRRRASWRTGNGQRLISRSPVPNPQLRAEGASHGPRAEGAPHWDAGAVRALRRHLGLTQAELAQELGTRQATISEWEHGHYQPRGASARILHVVAERAGFEYGSADDDG